MDTYNELLSFLKKLRSVNIHFELTQIRDEAVMILVTVPGQRWEIELVEDGKFQIEIFKSDGNIFDESALEDLFSKFSD